MLFRRAPLLLVSALASAATPAFHAMLDNSGSNWTALRGALSRDTTVLRDGRGSLRVAPGEKAGDACVRSAPLTLTIGKHYEVSGWIRTEDLEVRDGTASPVATGAAITMASLPFDVHSESLAGTRDWARVRLRFVATRAQDSILLTVGNTGSFRGQAWFEGMNIDEVSPADPWPVKQAVKTFGPAWRYPAAGWIYLHVEGKPYERGYQHGFLMAREIPKYLERCAADLGYAATAEGWQLARTTADALFLRGFDDEILQEMKGIAEGASAAGAKWQGRRIDLVDIVVANITVELDELRSAMPMTPTGLEGLRLEAPDYKKGLPVTERCSAFAATGPATRDGRMVIGHVTWWPLTLAEQTNVMLDIRPEHGHRLLMQSYPGGIESGTDWYQNDAGVVLTETTIRQTPFESRGTPVAFRARKAIQYGDDVDGVVRLLGEHNNGLYTNEWLIGDAKNNEIAMYELGTKRTKLWRSSRNEWFGGTEGFYWGCNNAKDLGVRMEYYPDPQGTPEYVPYFPGRRDLAWQDMYRQYRGLIDEQFAFTAFRTAPLVSAATMDAKIATADMASQMMVWGFIGRPNEREWLPGGSRNGWSGNDGLYPGGYRLFTTERPAEGETARAMKEEQKPDEPKKIERPWRGWILPAAEADTWFASGSAAYYGDLEAGNVDKAVAARWAHYRELQLLPVNDSRRVLIETEKGVIFLDALRRRMGDEPFLKLMSDFFAAHSTKAVSAQEFLAAAHARFELPVPPREARIAEAILERLPSTLLVYGTQAEAGANHYAALRLQTALLNDSQTSVPLRKDFEVSDEDLRTHDLLFVGRPETNSALARLAARGGIHYDGASFRVDENTHADEVEAIAYAAANPLDPAHLMLILAGNSPLATVKLVQAAWNARTEYTIYAGGKETASGFLK